MKGFTLVEMLVALLIFGLIAAASVAVMSFSIDNQQVVRSRTSELGDFQRARALLVADLQQAAPRRTREEVGGGVRPAFAGGGETALFSLVRRGWDNPDAAPRASLQYVEYAIEDGALVRRARTALDGAALGPPQVLIEHVKSAEVAFLTRGEWLPAWSSSPATPLPEAVRLDLDADSTGQVRQLFLLPGGAR